MAEATQVEEGKSAAIAQRTPKQIAWNRFKRNRTGVVAGIISIAFIVAAYAAPLITRIFKVGPYDLYLEALDPMRATTCVALNDRVRYEGWRWKPQKRSPTNNA